MSTETTTHASPPDGAGVTPCCGRTPFDLPATDCLTRDPTAVTCTPRPERVTLSEGEIQRAYAEIANEECLTILPVPGYLDRAYVPAHWREAATARALAVRLEQATALLDKEVAENVEDNVRAELDNVRCWGCNLRYAERDQYGCGEPGRAHNYDAEEIADAEASARADASEYVTLSVAALRAALRGETR